MSTDRKDNLLKIFAAVKDRRALEKELVRHRKNFQEARDLFNITNAKLQELQQIADHAQRAIEDARKGIVYITDTLQTMDLTGSNATRDRGDTTTYIVDKKEYHVDKSDANDIKLTPWKEYKSSKVQNDCGDYTYSEADDVADAADAFISAFE